MLEVGNKAGYFTQYRWTKTWWQISFPDGSYEIVKDQERNQLDEAIISGAHKLWSERALRKMVKGGAEPSNSG
jgi:hypothetical protein